MGILNDAINDPSTQQASMSRICFGVLVLFVILMAAFLAYQKVIEPLVDLLKTTLFSTAGLYGANSVARVVSSGKNAPASPGAPAAPAPGPDPGAPAPDPAGGAAPDPGVPAPDPGTIAAPDPGAIATPDPAGGHHAGPAKPAS